MAVINHQNNFSTNLTSNTSAGVTTTPIDSIPTVDAPFYLALDATNANSHYEVIYVTSKSATNVNHAATSYDHTTAEEVRMIVPAVEMDTMYQYPRGHLVNGKIVPSVASNNLTVALKTIAGADPSTTDPVYCRIGDTVRAITSALSVTKNAATNWCNSGGSELATKEVDYFVYLGYNATDGVVIGFSRIPSAVEYGDFSTTTTDEKYCAISTITNAASGDDYEVIGRFAATLSAGAGYTWTVPTFTNTNLIQRPIYETRWLSWTPAYSAAGSMTFTSVSTDYADYKIRNDSCLVRMRAAGTTGGSASVSLYMTAPFDGASASYVSTGCWLNNSSAGMAGTQTLYAGGGSPANRIQFGFYNNANWALGANNGFAACLEYAI